MVVSNLEAISSPSVQCNVKLVRLVRRVSGNGSSTPLRQFLNRAAQQGIDYTTLLHFLNPAHGSGRIVQVLSKKTKLRDLNTAHGSGRIVQVLTIYHLPTKVHGCDE